MNKVKHPLSTDYVLLVEDDKVLVEVGRWKKPITRQRVEAIIKPGRPFWVRYVSLVQNQVTWLYFAAGWDKHPQMLAVPFSGPPKEVLLSYREEDEPSA